jgi:hypothetical protein
MPEPHAKETLSSFTERYMSSEHARKKFPDTKQRYAVMRSKFKGKKKS